MADRSRRKYTEMADDLFGLKPLQVEPLEEEAEPFAVEPIAPSPAPKAQSVQTLKAPPAQDSAPKQEMNPVVRDYLMKKFGYEGDLSDDSLKQAQKDAEDNRRLTALAEAGAQIGGAIAGTGYNKAAFDSMREGADSKAKDILARRKAQTDELSAKSAHMKVAKEAESNDPDSAKSKAARDAYRKIAPKVVSGIPNYDMLSAADIEENLAKPLELYQRSEDRKLQYANIAEQKRQARQDKQDAKDEKKKTMLNEIEDRRQNINAALDTLDSMIKEYGTFELLGSHNQDMDRLVDQIATDMAKLQDPQSVARPGEVELVKKTLVQSGFKNSNATARDIIKNFRAEVDRRADSAYKIRGMEKPGSTTNAKSGTKSSSKYKPGDVINYKGKLYRVAPNGDDLEELM